jgi:phosphatidate phosphatase APP1
MSDWYDTFLQAASKLDEGLDRARLKRKIRRRRLRPIDILTYRGVGNAGLLRLRGRVLEHQEITGADAADNVWENLLNMYRRFNSQEIPGAQLEARFGRQVFETTADHEGYFDLRITPDEPLDLTRAWHEVHLRLLAPTVPEQPPVEAVGHVLIPPPQADYGVISDIDDTIVHTSATNPLAMARVVALNNPHTRIPFEGVAAFYQALRKGPGGSGYNPIFYVSSSPWNLYDLLIDFLNINGIPLGPLFLRDIGLEREHLLASGHQQHKIAQIETILESQPNMRFVLIGDSGQEDPEIYSEIVRGHPGRVLVVYIRDVSLGERTKTIQELGEGLRSSGVDMVLVADTVIAADDAVKRGLIRAGAVPKVEREKAKDEQAPPPPLVADDSKEAEGS